MADPQEFFVDEFFAPEKDEGREVEIELGGRKVPMTLSTRGITNEARMAAELAATSIQVKDGKVVATITDRGKASMELAARMILKWPFKDRETGEPLPITGENLGRMRAGADQILALVGEQELAREEAVAPFAAPSSEG